MEQIIEAAYMAGFEPSSEDLTAEELFNEAHSFLTNLSIN